MKQYQLKVVPLKGVTLAKRTWDEWVLGYDFKVVSSTSVKYKRGDWISIEDIHNDEKHYDVHFHINFLFQTVKEHFRTMAEDDHGWDQASKTLGVNK
tara:strand:+ start:996 stop:1286 length:291 start_codon:yes stop_codon:yes gene_type:complete